MGHGGPTIIGDVITLVPVPVSAGGPIEGRHDRRLRRGSSSTGEVEAADSVRGRSNCLHACIVSTPVRVNCELPIVSKHQVVWQLWSLTLFSGGHA